MHNAARRFDFQTLWPEAIVVYMQGLPTPSKIDKEGKEPGWQHFNGQLDNRDLKFFDQVLAFVRTNYHVDDKRIYATGSSNGGAFTYFSSGRIARLFSPPSPRWPASPGPTERPTVPKPAFIVAGEKDPLVLFESQQTMIAHIRELDKAAATKPQQLSDGTTLYESATNTPVVSLIHPGGHIIPPDATSLVTNFFKSHVLEK